MFFGDREKAPNTFKCIQAAVRPPQGRIWSQKRHSIRAIEVGIEMPSTPFFRDSVSLYAYASSVSLCSSFL